MKTNRVLQLNEMLNEAKLYNESEALDAIRKIVSDIKRSPWFKADMYDSTHGDPTPGYLKPFSEIELILRSVKLYKGK